jgi:hypothetical protein
MPQRVAEVRGAVVTSAATKLLLFPPETFLVPRALPEAAVAVAGRQTMHPPPPILLVDTIPIHPAKKCPPDETTREVDPDEGCFSGTVSLRVSLAVSMKV